ncbi:dehydration-responsive element-binding protein 1J-like [Panicum virgatum]|uniref:dehydration-responsive element-binding protein 1J-like n=1 Tax=Panicum virgatum TaxID=38727 RepID=UPI0019D5F651|nr:dehydration-responsive element-binding protein 1J-like [Panicum virgatum]
MDVAAEARPAARTEFRRQTRHPVFHSGRWAGEVRVPGLLWLDTFDAAMLANAGPGAGVGFSDSALLLPRAGVARQPTSPTCAARRPRPWRTCSAGRPSLRVENRGGRAVGHGTADGEASSDPLSPPRTRCSSSTCSVT